jgi:hypothetical protein
MSTSRRYFDTARPLVLSDKKARSPPRGRAFSP